MTIKDELHGLVDRLSEARASEVLVLLRHVVDQADVDDGQATSNLANRMGPRAMSGHDFFDQQPTFLELLANQQRVRPVANADALIGDFWPSDETVDDFVAAVRNCRREVGVG